MEIIYSHPWWTTFWLLIIFNGSLIKIGGKDE
jgi:hypothetical protein